MKHVSSTIVLALLLTGCGGGPAAEPPTINATTSPTPAIDSPQPSEAPIAEPTDSSEEDVKEALSAPTEAPDVDPIADPEQQFLQAYKTELQTLPDGPYAQLGSDEEAVQLGYLACEDIVTMGGHGPALFAYAFSDATEDQVADYNAALNAAQFTLCP